MQKKIVKIFFVSEIVGSQNVPTICLYQKEIT